MDKIDALLVRIRSLNHFTKNYQEDEQLGLLYIATFAREKGGYTVKVLDEYNITLDLLRRTLKTSSGGVLGFFCDHENIWSVLQVIRAMKKENPDLLTVLGGPQVSDKPWDSRAFAEAPVDIIVSGEGEKAFLEILDSHIKGKHELREISGLVFRSGDEIVATPPRPYEKNLDELPIPDRNLNFYGKKAMGNENLVTARGCPGQCAFCFEGRRIGIRLRSTQSVLEEVEMLLRDRNMIYLAILDDLFTTHKKRVMDICAGFLRLQKKYHRFVWFCEGRVNVISRFPEMAKAMREAGLLRLQIGVESGSQEVLDAYNKGISLDQIRECVDICHEADILSVIGNVIIGGAFENRETLSKTREFTCELMARAPGCFDFNTTIFTPYPGTAMYENPAQYGLNIIDRDCVTGMGDNYAFAETEALSKWDILDARHQLMESFETTAKLLIPRITEERRFRHFQAYYLYGIQTVWFQILANETRLYNYYGLQVSMQKHSLESMNGRSIYDMKPIRTINIGSSVDNGIVLPFLDQPMKMGKLGGRIYELCCGKLTTAQIIDRISDELSNGIERERIDSYVCSTLRALDKERLILFSEL